MDVPNFHAANFAIGCYTLLLALSFELFTLRMQYPVSVLYKAIADTPDLVPSLHTTQHALGKVNKLDIAQQKARYITYLTRKDGRSKLPCGEFRNRMLHPVIYIAPSAELYPVICASFCAPNHERHY
jgi:hypothetical protein